MQASQVLQQIPSSKTWKTLYLVSARSEQGEWLWKVGITKHVDPLRRNPKLYSETFRSVRLPWAWAHEIELVIAQTFNILERHEQGREFLSGSFGADDVMRIFDFWLDIAMDSQCYPIEEWEKADGQIPTFVGTCGDEEEGLISLFDAAQANFDRLFSLEGCNTCSLHEKISPWVSEGTSEEIAKKVALYKSSYCQHIKALKARSLALPAFSKDNKETKKQLVAMW